jgi:hypothetical protein
MNTVELIIFAIYALLIGPAVVGPLIWAAILDGRHDARQHHRTCPRGSSSAPAIRGALRLEAYRCIRCSGIG